MPQINLNSDAFVTLADKLERLGRSAFPLAVRQTLNDAAFDVKTRSLPASAARNFTIRNKNFFRTFSIVDKATGFKVNNMKATVGMDDRGKGIAAETAVNNMEKQEVGGIIDDGFDYLKDSRGGRSVKGVVRKINYYDRNRVVSGRSRSRGGTVKSKFVARAFRAKKENKPMFFNSIRGNYLMQVTSIKRLKNNRLKITSRLLMKERKGKPAKITPTHFTREAAEDTIKKINGFYAKAAQKQFERVLR